MKYNDFVYGEFKIKEPVLLEIIKSPSLQRLKYIDQAGYKPLYIDKELHIKEEDYNRFSHSVGVFLLLKKYNAPLEEQIIGLIHDVSHSCFSHSIDYILKAGSETKQNLQDNIFDNFVKNSELKNIIEKHGFDINYILDNDNFPLEEKDLPDLCADRIDYCLRDASFLEEVTKKEKEFILKNLTTKNQKWVFKNFESAKAFAFLFAKMNTKHYAGLKSAIMFRVIGDLMKYALKKEYITEKDLYTTDKEVISKIQKELNNDKKLLIFWDRMHLKSKITNNPKDYDVKISCKSRIVDPLFFNKKNKIKRISDVNQKWNKKLKKELKPKTYFLKFQD